VSWALSTAEAMRGRGDLSEALKWLRRAAESASEAEADDRALELAKAAADLAASVNQNARGAAPAANVLTRTLQTHARDLPGPVREAQARLAAQRAVPPVTAAASVPRAAPSRPAPAPAAHRVAAAQTAVSKSRPSGAKSDGKRRRAPALDEDARKAADGSLVFPTLDGIPADDPSVPTVEVPALGDEEAQELDRRLRARRKSRPDGRGKVPTMTDEWDAFPTQSLSGEEIATITSGDEKRADPPKETTRSTPPKAAAPRSLVTSQAVRVVLWRDANGVHIAPAGTPVAALAIDAMVVALDPDADVAAWLDDGGPPPGTRVSRKD
jgi:hypothetical protein